MKKRKNADRHANLVEARQAVRKPYRKPAVRHERVFETSALTCGKIHATQSSCRFNRRAS
jgi:hypothetical protein